MSKETFPQYTTDYLSGVMSLRSPQEASLKVLEDIVNGVPLCKDIDLKVALAAVKVMYPTCSDFEREFMSLTFALATGVGKTRLMGAFITYLYTQHDIRNFFVVAPGTTVYEKLKRDLSDPSNPKYVFKGLGCFANPPRIIADDDYKDRQLSLLDNGVNIYTFNIDKFNKDASGMKAINEYLGQSFYEEVASLDDLVLIMDESHHYRAEKGAAALNDLHPILGLELTATPLAKVGTKQVPFKNVVVEYPLSKAIEDGYTRTPFAVTRSNVDFFNFGDEQLDKMMINDGILCHENTRRKLEIYAHNNNDKAVIKPFMLIVCKDTVHATWVEKYVISDEFRDGQYRNKTITVHSKMSGAETDANKKLLLDVERADNPVEIVIHVNMLKEGWDVNNLYTIVPLRTAASKILREQMVGRGLRLPYGKRTGDKDVDAVMLTAHDKFKEILEEAQKGDSVFKAGNVIKAEDLQQEEIVYTQLSINVDQEKVIDDAFNTTGIEKTQDTYELLKKADNIIAEEIEKYVCNPLKETTFPKADIIKNVITKIDQKKDLGITFKENENPIIAWAESRVEELHVAAINKFIPIPHIKITDSGAEEYCFTDFDIDLKDFTHVPIPNELFVQNLKDMADRESIKGNLIDFESLEPKKIVLNLLRQKPEIDYEKCSELLFKLITQVRDHYEEQHGNNGMCNIVMMYKKDITNRLYNQMMQHFSVTNGFLKEEVVSVSKTNLRQQYSVALRKNLFENYESGIKSILFEGIKYGVFNTAKFDSKPELILARVLERDAGAGHVKNWLRPAKQEFNITYNRGHQYEPDFVVEMDDQIYLVEVKGEDKVDEADVISKKQRAIQYCATVSRWAKANEQKEWRHIFIPSQQILEQSSFEQLAKQFIVME